MSDAEVPAGHFRCALCQEIFEKAWTDEDSMAEALVTWGQTIPAEEQAHVCDGCYPEFKTWADSEGLTVDYGPGK